MEQIHPAVKILGVRDFPGGPVARTSPSTGGEKWEWGGAGSIPDRVAGILHASRPKTPKQKTETRL